ncbi:MAG: LysM peptidoglycan-binding domain-containing protein [Steroidobacteraceae bacterium]
MAALVAGLSALTLVAGCQSTPPESEAPRPLSVPAAAADQAPETAIDAALAREGSGPAPAAAPAAAGPVLNPNAPLSYTVKRGDTLWDISAMFLRDPWLWPEIWHVNPTVSNPHLIYPGDVLTLAYGADGRPQISLARGDAVHVYPLVRSSAADGPISSIPYEAIASFLGRPSIISKDDLLHAARVAGLRDSHLVASIGHDIYVKGLEERGPGRYSVVRLGEELKDPQTGKVLGYMGTFAASAQVDTVAKLSKAAVVESSRETVAGDLVFAEDLQTVSTDIVPHAPAGDVDGQIMAVVDGVSLIGQYQVVAINRGSRHGLETGHVLAIDQKGEVVMDGGCKRTGTSWCLGKSLQLPDERAGTMLVFKTYDAMSYALIVATTAPVRVADRVRTP